MAFTRSVAHRSRGQCSALLALLLLGCSDTEIIGSLELDGPRVRLEGLAGAVTSIGLIDGWVLLTTEASVTPPPGWSPYQDHTIEARVQWVSPDDEVGTTTTSVGWSTWSTIAPRWVRAGDRLVGAVWAVQGPEETQLPSTHGIAMWSFTAGGDTSCHDAPSLPVYADRDEFTISLGSDASAGDSNALRPIALLNGSAVALTTGQPVWMCDNARLITIAMNGCEGTAELPLPTPCRLEESDPGFAWVDAVSVGADLGVLYRPVVAHDSRVRWIVLGRDHAVPASPRVVGADYWTPTSATGRQPRGAAVGERVGFFEAANDRGTCFSLRMMNADGTDAGNAAWQLGCLRRDVITANVDLLPLVGAALSVASEWEQDGAARIVASVVTPSGRRGSEVVDVAAPSTTATAFRAAVDGNEAAMVYVDEDGLWLQRLSFHHQ